MLKKQRDVAIKNLVRTRIDEFEAAGEGYTRADIQATAAAAEPYYTMADFQRLVEAEVQRAWVLDAHARRTKGGLRTFIPNAIERTPGDKYRVTSVDRVHVLEATPDQLFIYAAFLRQQAKANLAEAKQVERYARVRERELGAAPVVLTTTRRRTPAPVVTH